MNHIVKTAGMGAAKPQARPVDSAARFDVPRDELARMDATMEMWNRFTGESPSVAEEFGTL